MIDLSAYTPKKRSFLKEYGYYCVYVVAGDRRQPSKVGIASDPVHRVSGLCVGSSEDLYPYFLLWTPGRPVAVEIELRAHELLKKAGKHRRGEWFNVPVEWAIETVKTASLAYPKLVFLDHTQMVANLQRKPIDKRDHVESQKIGIDHFRKSANKSANHIQAGFLHREPEALRAVHRAPALRATIDDPVTLDEAVVAQKASRERLSRDFDRDMIRIAGRDSWPSGSESRDHKRTLRRLDKNARKSKKPENTPA